MADNYYDEPRACEIPLHDAARMPPLPSLRWRRKTKDDVRKEVRRAKLHPMPPLLGGAGVAVLVTCASLPDVRHYWRGASLPQALAMFPLVFLICFVGLYLLQLGINPLQYRKQRQVTICTRCLDIAPNKGNDRCPCGGELDDANRWIRESGPELNQ